MMGEGEYIIAIDGKFSRNDIELQLQGEEAGASELVAIETGTYKGLKANLVTFRELEFGMPNDLTLVVVAAGTPPPAGTNCIWEGKMLIDGNEHQAALYRET